MKRPYLPELTETIFWSKVKKGEKCWKWVGYCSKRGYGQIGIDGKVVYTHRYSWTLHYGKIPEGFNVLHKCDNPSCVRPDHLFIGSQSDNAVDMMKKGRSGTAKLDKQDVLRIRNIYANGLRNFSEIGRMFGVADYAISSIIKKRQWWYL